MSEGIAMSTAEAVLGTPPHVPRDLIWRHNVDEFPMLFADPYIDACDAMHAGPDIVWATGGAHGGRPGWVLTRFDHLEEVYHDAKTFSAAHSHGAARFLGIDILLLPMESDPPDHHFYRMALLPYFQPSAIKALRSALQRICDELLAPFSQAGGCEFIADFASLFPSYVFLELMGMSRKELPRFLEWEDAFLRGATWDIQVAGTRAIYDYLKDYAAQMRANPRDNLVSQIVNTEVDGRLLTENEAIGICMSLYLGGLDTVMSSLGWYMRHLAKDPALQARLRENPALMPDAVQEFLRAYAVTSTFRTVMKDLEFHGVPMRNGDIVALPTFFAARDARTYLDPHVIKLERKARHLSFGTGAHNCLGIHLAKLEIEIVLQSFLRRFTNIRMAPDKSETWTTVMIWGVRRLPLVWDR